MAIERVTIGQLRGRGTLTGGNFNGDKNWLIGEVQNRINGAAHAGALNGFITASMNPNIVGWQERIRGTAQQGGAGGRRRTQPTIVGYANEVIDLLNTCLNAQTVITDALALPVTTADQITAKITELNRIIGLYPTGSAAEQAVWAAGTNENDVRNALTALTVAAQTVITDALALPVTTADQITAKITELNRIIGLYPTGSAAEQAVWAAGTNENDVRNALTALTALTVAAQTVITDALALPVTTADQITAKITELNRIIGLYPTGSAAEQAVWAAGTNENDVRNALTALTVAAQTVITDALALPVTTADQITAKITELNRIIGLYPTGSAAEQAVWAAGTNENDVRNALTALTVAAQTVITDALALPVTTADQITAKITELNRIIGLYPTGSAAEQAVWAAGTNENDVRNALTALTVAAQTVITDALALPVTTADQITAKITELNRIIGLYPTGSAAEQAVWAAGTNENDVRNALTALTALTVAAQTVITDALALPVTTADQITAKITELNRIIGLYPTGSAAEQAVWAAGTNENDVRNALTALTVAAQTVITDALALPVTTADQITAKITELNRIIGLYPTGSAAEQAVWAAGTNENDVRNALTALTVAAQTVITDALALPVTTADQITAKITELNRIIGLYPTGSAAEQAVWAAGTNENDVRNALTALTVAAQTVITDALALPVTTADQITAKITELNRIIGLYPTGSAAEQAVWAAGTNENDVRNALTALTVAAQTVITDALALPVTTADQITAKITELNRIIGLYPTGSAAEQAVWAAGTNENDVRNALTALTKLKTIYQIITNSQSIFNKDDATKEELEQAINDLKVLANAATGSPEGLVWQEKKTENEKLLTDLETKLSKIDPSDPDKEEDNPDEIPTPPPSPKIEEEIKKFGADYVNLETEQKEGRQKIVENWKKEEDYSRSKTCRYCPRDFHYDKSLEYLAAKEKVEVELKNHEDTCSVNVKPEEVAKVKQDAWEQVKETKVRHFYSCRKCWGKIKLDKSIADWGQSKTQAIADLAYHEEHECGQKGEKMIAIYFSPNQGGNKHAPLTYAEKINENELVLEKDNQGEIYQESSNNNKTTPISWTPWIIAAVGIIFTAAGIVFVFFRQSKKDEEL